MTTGLGLPVDPAVIRNSAEAPHETGGMHTTPANLRGTRTHHGVVGSAVAANRVKVLRQRASGYQCGLLRRCIWFDRLNG